MCMNRRPNVKFNKIEKLKVLIDLSDALVYLHNNMPIKVIQSKSAILKRHKTVKSTEIRSIEDYDDFKAFTRKYLYVHIFSFI